MVPSKLQQFADCQAALAALQDEIKVAKEERKSAETQLEKAIQEGFQSKHRLFFALVSLKVVFLAFRRRFQRESGRVEFVA
jgi:hypothetical protein